MFRETEGIADDFRFALSVLEEHSHLGLDSTYASKIRAVIERKIKNAENAGERRPVASIHVPSNQADLLQTR